MKTRARGRPSPRYEGLPYAHQVMLLLAVAELALDAEPEADAAIRACAVAAPVPDQTAIDLGRALRGYSRLYHQLEVLVPDPDLAQVRGDLLAQLSYHLHMLRDAGDLVFSGRHVAVNERFRRELGEGLGPHVHGLEQLRRALVARLAAAVVEG